MTALNFNRIAKVEVETSNGLIIIEGLDMDFNVDFYAGETANAAVVNIKNLSELTRNNIQELNAEVSLFCGYSENTGYELLFKGQAQYVFTEKVGVDINTRIECQDAVQVLRQENAILNFTTNTPVKHVLDEIARLFGVPVKFITDVNEYYPLGYAFSGKLKDALNEVTKRFGLTWNFINGELVILRLLENLNGDALLITPETGLIGSPSPIIYQGGLLDENTKEGQPVLQIQTLLLPKIKPADLILLQSLQNDGQYSVVNVSHDGSTYGNNWYSTLELRQ